MKIAIIYGSAEGKWHSREFRRQLVANGYTLVADPKQADVIIAHSGGCLIIPKNNARLVMMVGYSYWPGKPLATSIKEIIRAERHRPGQTLIGWLGEGVSHLIYLGNIRHTIRLAKQWKYRQQLLQTPPGQRILFVRNQHDPYCEPSALVRHAPIEASFVSLPGSHNYLWQVPIRLIELIKISQ